MPGAFIMTKRRAERVSRDETPQKRHCSVLEPEAGRPPALLLKRRRRKASCSEDRDSPEQENVRFRKTALCDVQIKPEHARLTCISGKVQGATGPPEEGTREMSTVRPKRTDTKPRDQNKVMQTDAEGELSQFNTYQFWRTPLPALDLSLLDPLSTPDTSGDASLNDGAEAMET